MAHQRPLEFQVGVHPAFALVGRIEIVCHDLSGETSTFGMSLRTTIGAGIATIMAFAQHQNPLRKQCRLMVVVADMGIEENHPKATKVKSFFVQQAFR
ncbi:MAG: hypothetical protein MJ000_05285 [Bacteroidales bacterium]|nr:hypothetical protein [Bacteroidales bacterium]